ncbi:MAG: type II secretion system protein GspG [Polyangiaceae bacterium]|nr:type II secretion system protein GspG [Polyangiaceae bacterium]
MRRRRSVERRIFFPWEGHGGFRRWLGLGRFRPFALAVGAVVVVVLVGLRERRAAGLRETRASLLRARSGVETYLIDHDGGCPPSLAAIAEDGRVPQDAWGRPLRLVCPGRRPDSSFELMSDGPDGIAQGLDRIE